MANGVVMFGNAYGANISRRGQHNFAAATSSGYRDAVIDDLTVSTRARTSSTLPTRQGAHHQQQLGRQQLAALIIQSLAAAKAAYAQNLNGFYDPVLKNDVLVVFSAGNDAGARMQHSIG